MRLQTELRWLPSIGGPEASGQMGGELCSTQLSPGLALQLETREASLERVAEDVFQDAVCP